jgi:translocator protein
MVAGSMVFMGRTLWLALALAVICVGLGWASAMLGPVDAWYATLRKPTWTPPGSVIGTVWTVLYAMMGVAMALVLGRGWEAGGVKRATLLFACQLLANLAWSPVFFGLHSVGGALIIIILLWMLIGWTVAAFWSVHDVAGVLLLPYWLWVTFATALNAAIWRMN